MVPNTVVVGTGVQLLYFFAVATLLGVGVASLTLNFLRKGHAADEEHGRQRRLWSFYLVVLLPVTAFLAYRSVYVNDRYDVLFLAGFLMFSAGAGVLIGYVRVRGHDQWFFPGLVAAYIAAVFAALCIAARATHPGLTVRRSLLVSPVSAAARRLDRDDIPFLKLSAYLRR
ncbi:MAG: hypothetical protein LC751_05635 [Actinobacteria bacterium]|nr:hypothetical protein [Actinomycetota bacterium]